MGSLKPGATYVYERVGGTVYARESGSTERTVVGYMQEFVTSYELETVWKDIIQESKVNPLLHEALENVKIIYYLSKNEQRN
jgi:hypothetical protein